MTFGNAVAVYEQQRKHDPRRVFQIAIDAGVRYDNPALAAIWVKEHTKKQVKLPESEQFEMLVKEIENSGSGFAEPLRSWCNF